MTLTMKEATVQRICDYIGLFAIDVECDVEWNKAARIERDDIEKRKEFDEFICEMAQKIFPTIQRIYESIKKDPDPHPRRVFSLPVDEEMFKLVSCTLEFRGQPLSRHIPGWQATEFLSFARIIEQCFHSTLERSLTRSYNLRANTVTCQPIVKIFSLEDLSPSQLVDRYFTVEELAIEEKKGSSSRKKRAVSWGPHRVEWAEIASDS